jgi:hypothetical protein
MPTVINGLPAHVLLLHVVVVLVPLAAVMLIASAVWPAARAKLGFLTPAVALVALVFVPVTTNAGHYLYDHLHFTNSALRKHVSLGDDLLPWVIALFVVSAAVWILHRRYDMPWRPAGPDPDQPEPAGSGGTSVLTQRRAAKQALPVWVTALVAVAAIAVSVGTVIQLYRIGDSGAHAVWGGTLKNG